MTLTSRKFQEGDYEEFIQKLTRDNMRDYFVKNFGGWSDQVSKKKLLKVVKEGVVKLFFAKDVFVGYVSFNIEAKNKESLLINDIHVVKLFQRKDYGFKMLQSVIRFAENSQMKQLKVFVFKENYAVNFYKKNGFEISKELVKSNSVIMVKKL